MSSHVVHLTGLNQAFDAGNSKISNGSLNISLLL